jgi:hypothetical protein
MAMTMPVVAKRTAANGLARRISVGRHTRRIPLPCQGHLARRPGWLLPFGRRPFPLLVADLASSWQQDTNPNQKEPPMSRLDRCPTAPTMLASRIAALAVAATLAVAPLHAASTAPGTAAPKTIVGAWQLQITPEIQPIFTALTTFTADGNVAETNSLALVTPLSSPGHGRWAFAPHENTTFDLTFVNLLTDEQGAFAGTAEVRARVSLTDRRNGLEGTFEVDVRDPAGAVVFSDHGTVHGARIEVQPLQ